MNMAVIDFVAGNDEPDAFAREGRLECPRDAMRHGKKMRGQLGRKIHPVIDLQDWNDKNMTVRDGIDRHENDALVVAVNECAGDRALDDTGEDRRHQA